MISEVLIIGPIPPFLKKSHLAANPGAIITQGQGRDELEGEGEGVGHVPDGVVGHEPD